MSGCGKLETQHWELSADRSGMSTGDPLGHPDHVEARKDWPKNSSETSKFPTIAAFAEDNKDHEDFDGHPEPYIAFEVPKGMKTTSFTKTCMPRSPNTSPFDDIILLLDIAKKLLRPSEPAKKRQGMVEILRYTRKIHEEKMVSELGRDLGPNDNFHYVFTYPAACSEAGKQTLRDAVEEAGFEDRNGDKITYISEAHAAASAAFIDSRKVMNRTEWLGFWKV